MTSEFWLFSANSGKFLLNGFVAESWDLWERRVEAGTVWRRPPN